MTQQTRDRLELGLQFVKVVGVPTAILAVVLWFIGVATDRLHESVLVPTVTAGVQFLKATTETQGRQAEALEVLAASKEHTTQILHEIAEGQRDIKRAIDELSPEPKPTAGKR